MNNKSRIRSDGIKNKEGGFTLLEMIVAIGVFSVAIIMSVGAFLIITNAQKKAVALQDSMDNLRFAFEIMTKEVRTGRSYHCGFSASDISLTPQDCSSGGVSFTFQSAPSLETVTYQIVDSQLVKSTNGTRPCDGVPATPEDCRVITAKTVVILDRLVFYVDGAPAGDTKQPKVVIVLEGQVIDPSGGAGSADLSLQTTISQINIDS